MTRRGKTGVQWGEAALFAGGEEFSVSRAGKGERKGNQEEKYVIETLFIQKIAEWSEQEHSLGVKTWRSLKWSSERGGICACKKLVSCCVCE